MCCVVVYVWWEYIYIYIYRYSGHDHVTSGDVTDTLTEPAEPCADRVYAQDRVDPDEQDQAAPGQEKQPEEEGWSVATESAQQVAVGPESPQLTLITGAACEEVASGVGSPRKEVAEGGVGGGLEQASVHDDPVSLISTPRVPTFSPSVSTGVEAGAGGDSVLLQESDVSGYEGAGRSYRQGGFQAVEEGGYSDYAGGRRRGETGTVVNSAVTSPVHVRDQQTRWYVSLSMSLLSLYLYMYLPRTYILHTYVYICIYNVLSYCVISYHTLSLSLYIYIYISPSQANRRDQTPSIKAKKFRCIRRR